MPLTRSLIAVLLCSVCSGAIADWTLNADDSRLSFSFVKKQHVIESGGFGHLSGTINIAGQASVVVGLTTVSTKNEVRDQRMEEILFETKTYPLASYRVHLDSGALNQALTDESGGQQLMTLNGKLDLHGIIKLIDAEVIVTKTGPNRLSVDSARPMIINAADYGLVGGLDKLQSVAGLTHIAHAVPITFHLVFDAD
jgi:polyisoprenoid-binding protein YceI